VPAYHIEDADAVDVVSGAIRHQPIGTKSEVITSEWLGQARVIGITAGASTPNNKVGETIARISAVAGLDRELRATLSLHAPDRP
jgi:4-hydroxy-3-methylbut-2-en-1-yl diphosphate reductase